MPRAHSTRRRLLVALTTVLTVTGAGALEAPARAASIVAETTAGAALVGDGVSLVRHTVPPVIELTGKDYVPLEWELTQDGWATVVLRHKQTGITTSHRLGSAGHPRTFRLFWDAFDPVNGDVPNGDYTWTITAESTSGAPLDFTASGSFTVVRKPQPHDFNDNGSLDVLQRDHVGVLWRSTPPTSTSH